MSETRLEVDKAIEKASGAAELAKALSESVQTVTNWRRRGIPVAKCQAVAQLTGMTVRELRPDDWADYWPALAEPAKA